jgi:hypothetical protein
MAQGGIIMCRIGYCPGCQRHGVVLTNHHVWKRSVWGRDKKKRRIKIPLCKDCHPELERLIQEKENVLLQENPQIYIGTLCEFLKKANDGVDVDIDEFILEEPEIKPQITKRERSRAKQRGDLISYSKGLAVPY